MDYTITMTEEEIEVMLRALSNAQHYSRNVARSIKGDDERSKTRKAKHVGAVNDYQMLMDKLMDTLM